MNRPRRRPSGSTSLKRHSQTSIRAMEAIDAFKVQALNSMQTTITTLSTEVQKSQAYLAHARDSEPPGTGGARERSEELKIPEDRT